MKALNSALNTAIGLAGVAVAFVIWRHLGSSEPPPVIDRRGVLAEQANSVSGSSPTATQQRTAPVQNAREAESSVAPENSNISARPERTAFDRLVERFEGQRGYEGLGRSVRQIHESIMSVEDEPAWTRPTEQALREFIYAQPEASGLEISSIACRRNGCEVQILGTLSSPQQTPKLEGWQALVSHVRASQLANELQVEQTFMATTGDRTAYITVLKRLPGHNASTEP